MLNLAVWTSVLKVLKIDPCIYKKSLKKSLMLFDDIESKINRIRKEFSASISISDYEIDEYKRYISTLTCLLIKNLISVIHKILRIFINCIERTLEKKEKGVVRIKKINKCYLVIENEFKDENSVIIRYQSKKIEEDLKIMRNLHEILSLKYSNNS